MTIKLGFFMLVIGLLAVWLSNHVKVVNNIVG
jgi:hypothetical protein